VKKCSSYPVYTCIVVAYAIEREKLFLWNWKFFPLLWMSIQSCSTISFSPSISFLLLFWIFKAQSKWTSEHHSGADFWQHFHIEMNIEFNYYRLNMTARWWWSRKMLESSKFNGSRRHFTRKYFLFTLISHHLRTKWRERKKSPFFSFCSMSNSYLKSDP
jgi:hypothetical protein